MFKNILKIIYVFVFLLLTYGLIGAIESNAAERHDYRPGYSGGYHDRHSYYNSGIRTRNHSIYPKSYIVYDVCLFDKHGVILEPRPIFVQRNEHKNEYRPNKVRSQRRYHE